MRQVIAYENTYHPHTAFLESGSIKWDGEYPITVAAAWERNPSRPLGFASDIRREDDEITAEIKWTDEEYQKAVDDGFMDLTLWCNSIDANHYDDVMVVHSAVLRMVYPTVGVPWCRFWYDGYPGIPHNMAATGGED